MSNIKKSRKHTRVQDDDDDDDEKEEEEEEVKSSCHCLAEGYGMMTGSV